MSLIAEWRARVTEERVDALIVQASDLLEVAELHPMRLPGQRARRQASYLRSRAEELWQTMAPAHERMGPGSGLLVVHMPTAVSDVETCSSTPVL